jgi:small subunit ribosomal protein S3
MANERKFVTENIRRVLLKEYMMAKAGRAGFGGLDVQRTPMGTRVTLITERPGLVIGRRGEAIKSLTRAVEEDFNFNNPQIEVQEVDNPNLNAQIMAEKLASALERGWHFRRAGHSTVRRIMESGARGCQVTVAGKLTGQRHRREKFKDGHIKFCGQAKLDFMEKGFANARMKPGVIGVTVQIMHPDARLPDEIDIIPPPEPVAAPAAPAVEAEKELEEKAADDKAAEAVEELKKTAEGEEEKPKKAPAKARKKKEPSAEDEEKKPRKRKKAEKKEGGGEPDAAEKKVEAEAEQPVETPAKEKAEPEKPEAKAGVAPASEALVAKPEEQKALAEAEAPKAKPVEQKLEAKEEKKDDRPSEGA